MRRFSVICLCVCLLLCACGSNKNVYNLTDDYYEYYGVNNESSIEMPYCPGIEYYVGSVCVSADSVAIVDIRLNHLTWLESDDAPPSNNDDQAKAQYAWIWAALDKDTMKKGLAAIGQTFIDYAQVNNIGDRYHLFVQLYTIIGVYIYDCKTSVLLVQTDLKYMKHADWIYIDTDTGTFRGLSTLAREKYTAY